MTGDGVESTADHEWADHSYTLCAECRYDDDLDCFREKKVNPLRALQHVLRTLVEEYPHLLDERMLPRDAEMLRRLRNLVSPKPGTASTAHG